MRTLADAPLLLVGSLALDNEDQVFDQCGRLLSDVLFAMPDGETGERAIWVCYEAKGLYKPHPDIVTLSEPQDEQGNPQPFPSFLFDCWNLTVADGVDALNFDSLPRIQDAIDNYAKFNRYREDGVIDSDVKFQVCLPMPESTTGWFFRERFARDYPILEPAYEDAMARELARLFETVPADDLVLQWDICFEVLDLQRLFMWTPVEGAWERFIGPVRRLSPLVPEEVTVGYHLCYGTLGGWPMKEQIDMAQDVRMCNAIVEEAGRRVDYFQFAGPRPNRSEEDDFYRPLSDLRIGDAKVYLGLVHDVDGTRGLRIRVATAKKYLDDFGISACCGFGRRPGEEMEKTLGTHRADVDCFLEL